MLFNTLIICMARARDGGHLAEPGRVCKNTVAYRAIRRWFFCIGIEVLFKAFIICKARAHNRGHLAEPGRSALSMSGTDL